MTDTSPTSAPHPPSTSRVIDIVAGALSKHSREIERCLVVCIDMDSRANGQMPTWRLGDSPGDFGRQFDACFRQFAVQEVGILSAGGPAKQGSNRRLTLEIVSDEESELQAVVSAMSHRMGASLEDDVRGVNRHLASMLGMVEIPENHSPVGPAVVVHSAARVLQNFGFGGALLRQLLKHLTGPLTSALQQSYRELESQFASDPGLHAPRNRAVGPTSSQQGQSSNEGGPGGVSRFGPSTLRGSPSGPLTQGQSAGAAGPVNSSAIELVSSLLQRMQSASSASVAQASMNSSAALPASTAPDYWLPPLGEFLRTGDAVQEHPVAAVPPVVAPAAALPLLAEALSHLPLSNALVALLRRTTPAATAPAPPAVAEEMAPLDASLAGMEALAEAAQEGERFSSELRQFHAWRRGLRELVEGDASRVSSRVALDMVAEMFDSMCACELVPAVLRRKSLALQVVMLKFAIHEPRRFFAVQKGCSLAVERIAVCSVGTRADDSTLQEQWDKTIAAVARCMDDPARNKEEVESALRSLETAVADGYRDRSPRAIAERQAVEWMRRCVPQDTRFSFLKQFLLWTWSRVVAEAMRDSKLSEVRTPRYVKTAKTTVWSVKLDLSAEQRERLRRLMPGLVRTLREGIRTQQWSESAELDFLGKLMRSHRRSLGLPDPSAPMEPGEQVVAAEPSPAPAAAPAPAGDAEVGNGLPSKRPAVAAGAADLDRVACPFGLRLGCDYLVWSGGAMHRMRLQGAPRSSRNYVFYGQSGACVEFSAQEIRDLLMSARVVPVDAVDERSALHA